MILVEGESDRLALEALAYVAGTAAAFVWALRSLRTALK